MKQLNREEAIKLAQSEKWREWSSEQKAYFQLHQDRLCMPFDEFHKAITEQLNRAVYTHGFANIELLRSELEGVIPAPTFEQLMEPIADKVIAVIIND